MHKTISVYQPQRYPVRTTPKVISFSCSSMQLEHIDPKKKQAIFDAQAKWHQYPNHERFQLMMDLITQLD